MVLYASNPPGKPLVRWRSPRMGLKKQSRGQNPEKRKRVWDVCRRTSPGWPQGRVPQALAQHVSRSRTPCAPTGGPEVAGKPCELEAWGWHAGTPREQPSGAGGHWQGLVAGDIMHQMPSPTSGFHTSPLEVRLNPGEADPQGGQDSFHPLSKRKSCDWNDTLS